MKEQYDIPQGAVLRPLSLSSHS